MFTTSLKLLLNRKYFQLLLAYTWPLSFHNVHKSLCYLNNSLITTLNGSCQIRCKSYNRFLDYSKVPKLEENDLEERHVRGSGPGGQATNKTCNAVMLKHKPTNLVVKCHETRSLSQNRKIARQLLLTKLDNLLNAEDSLESQEQRLRIRDTIKKKQKQKKLASLKKTFETHLKTSNDY